MVFGIRRAGSCWRVEGGVGLVREQPEGVLADAVRGARGVVEVE
jgi:hypothetical protein